MTTGPIPAFPISAEEFRMQQATPIPPHYHRRGQRGVSLIAVLVILLLSLMAVMGAIRVANLNELLIGSTTDYSRALAAAEALLRDAEQDIRTRTVPSNDANGNPQSWYPQSTDDILALQDLIKGTAFNALTGESTSTSVCKLGVCIPNSATELVNVDTLTSVGATYGQYTQPTVDPGVSGNPILHPADGVARAWYWVELLRYGQTGAVGPSNVKPDIGKPFVYRITALAQGLKGGTRVVLKSVYVPFPQKQ
jgi:type IV pilus assembly protein PilX